MVNEDTEPAVKTFLCVYVSVTRTGTHQPVSGKANEVTQKCVCVCIHSALNTAQTLWPFNRASHLRSGSDQLFTKYKADLIYDLVVIVSKSQMFDYRQSLIHFAAYSSREPPT